jgi:predicted DNA-binding transcriptional regulator YafY
MYRVSRVASATMLDRPAIRPADLDLAEVWQRLRDDVERPPVAPVQVVLRVRADTSAMLLRVCAPQLAPGEEAARPVAEEPGWHRLTVSFRALGAALGALLGFGDAVEVAEPLALRAEMARVAASVVRLYADA